MRIDSIVISSLITLSLGLNCTLPSSPNDSEQLALLPLLAPQPVVPAPEPELQNKKPRVRFFNGVGTQYNFGLCVNFKCAMPDSQDVYYSQVPDATYSGYKTLAVFHGYISVFGARENIPRIEFPGSKTETIDYTCTVTVGGPEYTVVCEKD